MLLSAALAVSPTVAHSQLLRSPGWSARARAAVVPDTLRVFRPMSQLERGVVLLSTAVVGGTWGLGGAAAGGVVGLASCLQRDRDRMADRLRGCRAGLAVAIGGAGGVLAGAASGAGTSARRLGCAAGESRRRAWRGALVGSVLGAIPVAAYAASDRRSLLAEAGLSLVVPALQVGAAARSAGRCRLPVPILRRRAPERGEMAGLVNADPYRRATRRTDGAARAPRGSEIAPGMAGVVIPAPPAEHHAASLPPCEDP